RRTATAGATGPPRRWRARRASPATSAPTAAPPSSTRRGAASAWAAASLAVNRQSVGSSEGLASASPSLLLSGRSHPQLAAGRESAPLLELEAALLRAEGAFGGDGAQRAEGAGEEGELGAFLERHRDPRRLLDVLAP